MPIMTQNPSNTSTNPANQQSSKDIKSEVPPPVRYSLDEKIKAEVPKGNKK
jgi:hypothetical protein